MGEFWPIYAICGARGVTPPEVDRMEVWEVAAFLGTGMRDDEDEQQPQIVPFSKGGVDPNLARRIARHLGKDAPDIELPSYHPRMGRLN